MHHREGHPCRSCSDTAILDHGHVYRYGPLRITCVDRDVPIDVRVNAHLMYKTVLSWEDKARCATPFDMIARDLGEF